MSKRISANSTLSAPKRRMLAALELSLGVVSIAAKSAGIDRKTHYNWLNSDPKYKAEVDLIPDAVLDVAEDELYKLIKTGNVAAIIFFLKTKGVKRGFVERQKIEHSGSIAAIDIKVAPTEELMKVQSELLADE